MTLDDGSANEFDHQVTQVMRGIGIPPCPAILIKLDQLIHFDEPDYQRIGDTLSEDVALSAGLIKVANSPQFGLRKKVRSVHEALLVIGLKSAMHAVAGIELARVFEHTPRLERFWHASAKTAHTAAWLANQLALGDVRPVDAYTFGLFQDCGVPVLAAPFKNYLDILQQANADTERTFTVWEDETIGVNHAEIGANLAREWFLPEDVCTGIRFHHNPQALNPEATHVPHRSRTLIALAQFAEHLSHVITGLSFTREWSKLGEKCLHSLGLDEHHYASILEARKAALVLT
jgi:HD-like signal output (HDOD) protein